MKAEELPKDIEWHFIGHLQTNKIKMVVPYASLIHSVDSLNLLNEIERYCEKRGLVSDILLQLHIASEETKQGFAEDEILEIFDKLSRGEAEYSNIRFRGLMGMASLTDDQELIHNEFARLVTLRQKLLKYSNSYTQNFDQLSFGMSSDYKIAIKMGSTLVRIGTYIFGERQNN